MVWANQRKRHRSRGAIKFRVGQILHYYPVFSEGKIFDFLLFGTSDSKINFIVNDVEIVWSDKLLDALQPLLVLNEEALFDFELYRLTWPDTIVSRQL